MGYALPVEHEWGFDPLAFLVVLGLGLAGALALARRLGAEGCARIEARWARPEPGGLRWLALAALTLLASAPLVPALLRFAAEGATLPGDAAAHAQVAREIAEQGLPRGWIASYSAGFPFGPHYQSGALLVTAALIRAGLSPLGATHAVGLLATLLVPLLFLVAARAAGARPSAALSGALLLSWLVPVHTFMGGPWVMLSQGLVAQVFATPLLLLTAMAVLGSAPQSAAPVLAACAMASHAQLTLCAFAAAAPALLVAGSPGARRRFVLAGAGAALLGAALYGPGARVFSLPFSWPRVPPFRVVGYMPDRLARWWFQGELLDAGRLSALTGALWVASIALIFCARSRAARGALAFLASALALSFSGHALVALGPLGARVVEIFSPVRMLCVVPIAAAVAVCVGWTELSARIERALERTRAAWILRLRLLDVAVLGFLAAGAGAHAIALMQGRVAAEAAIRQEGCATEGFGGYRAPAIVDRLHALDRGRFVVHKNASRTPCPTLGGVELESAAPLGAGTAGPGSQLGVLMLAFEVLRADREGGAARAEALGVRALLHPHAEPPAPREAWRVLAASDQAALSERIAGTDEIGVGCVAAIWRGEDRALRDALFADLESADPEALRPTALVLLEPSGGPVRKEAALPGACDAAGATVEIRRREPGAYAAIVRTPTEVDIVVRATWFSTWSFFVNGADARARLVAPGFSAVRVPPGEHRIEAVVTPLPGYMDGLVAAGAGVGLLAWIGRRWPRRDRRAGPRAA